MGSMTPWEYLIVSIPLSKMIDIDGESGVGGTNGIDNVTPLIPFTHTNCTHVCTILNVLIFVSFELYMF